MVYAKYFLTTKKAILLSQNGLYFSVGLQTPDSWLQT